MSGLTGLADLEARGANFPTTVPEDIHKLYACEEDREVLFDFAVGLVGAAIDDANKTGRFDGLALAAAIAVGLDGLGFHR